MLSRRRFIGITGGVAAGAVGGAALWRARVDDHVRQAMGPGPEATTAPTPGRPGRVLVVLQLGGGNDGLNTLVPSGDGRYHDARPSLGVADADVVALAGLAGHGLHPALAPLAPWWAQGRLAVVQGAGLPGQSRSHFQALDTWWRGSADRSVPTGWLGRWLDAVGDPTDPLRAVALGAGSPALVGERAASTVVLDPHDFALRTPPGADAAAVTAAFLATSAPLADDTTVAAAQAAIPATLHAVDALRPAITPPTDDGDRKGDPGVSTLLDLAARVIGLGLGTQVVVASVSGFDTHTDQQATHAELLTDLAGGLDRFLATVDRSGRADDVLVVTTSEFGRRVAENGSGTDHGQASVQLLAGAPVARAQLVGDADLGRLDEGDLPISVDTRSVYAAALDWLGGPTDDIVGGAYDRYGLVRV